VPGVIITFRDGICIGRDRNVKFPILPDISDFFVLKVPDSSFEILVEYISGTRGHARQMVVEKTMKVIKAVELWSKLSEEGLKDEDIAKQVPDGKIPEVIYERARSILQSVDDV
jgi:hypothetical protein